MNPFQSDLKHALSAGHPLIYLFTEEEERAVDTVTGFLPEGFEILEWACSSGLTDKNGALVEDICQPLEVLEYIKNHSTKRYYVLKDFDAFFGDPIVVRSLKDFYQHSRNEDIDCAVFIIAAQLNLPESLRQSLYVIDVALPDTDELIALVREVTGRHSKKEIADKAVREIALTLGGMTLNESYHILTELVSQGHLSRQSLLDEIRHAKKSSITGADYLEYVPLKQGIDQVAGLGNFKNWMSDRTSLFTQQAVDAGKPSPRGILIMGVSGCGKSLCAKVIANVWNVPLFRLDMNLVFSGMHGNPQSTFHKALKTIEAMAPVVLWIDEIENGLGSQDIQNSVQSHIFSAFLTWMQEKPPLVFVAATANRIEYLPAEMIRKGRFDQVFFVDLPKAQDRADMINLYLQRHGANPDDFDIDRIVQQTEEWNGAEIEQVIESARIHAMAHDREFNTDDVVNHAQNIVPLSQTMSEQIKALRDWAWDRATPASSDNSLVVRFDEADK